MIIGVIDIGSNSIRLSIYQYHGDSIKILIHKKFMAGLVRYLENGQLSKKGINKILSVLEECSDIINGFHLRAVYAFATASLRAANNAYEVIDLIYQKTKIKVDMISGIEEARLTSVGAAYHANITTGLFVDIGGASTELVFFQQDQNPRFYSLPLGCLSLRIDCIDGILATRREVKQICKKIKDELDKIDFTWKVEHGTIYGIGGTIRSAKKIIDDRYPLSTGKGEMQVQDVRKLNQMLIDQDLATYNSTCSVAPERTHTILPGVMLLHLIMEKFYAEKVIVSKYGVREGYLIDRIIGRED